MKKRPIGIIPYLLLLGLTVLLGYFVFRIRVRKDYEQKKELPLGSTLLEFLIFAIHANLPYTYWAINWLGLPAFPKNPAQMVVGILFMGVGFAYTIIAMGSLGFRKAMGQKQITLKRSGMYRYTRNPQLFFYGVLVLGVVLLWPSGYALGWFLIYGLISHLMVLTEEEHLGRVFGSEFDRYLREVPRYLPRLMPRKK